MFVKANSVMAQMTQEFDNLLDLHDRIKLFKSEVSARVLSNFSRDVKAQSKLGTNVEMAKFMKVTDDFRKESEQIERLHLSSTATCAYTYSDYLKLWREIKLPLEETKLAGPLSYWNYIVDGLQKTDIDELQLTDEFSLLNILSLLRKLENKIENKKKLMTM